MSIDELNKELKSLRFYKAKTIAANIANVSNETLRKYLRGELGEREDLKEACINTIEMVNKFKKRLAKARAKKILEDMNANILSQENTIAV